MAAVGAKQTLARRKDAAIERFQAVKNGAANGTWRLKSLSIPDFVGSRYRGPRSPSESSPTTETPPDAVVNSIFTFEKTVADLCEKNGWSTNVTVADAKKDDGSYTHVVGYTLNDMHSPAHVVTGCDIVQDVSSNEQQKRPSGGYLHPSKAASTEPESDELSPRFTPLLRSRSTPGNASKNVSYDSHSYLDSSTTSIPVTAPIILTQNTQPFTHVRRKGSIFGDLAASFFTGTVRNLSNVSPGILETKFQFPTAQKKHSAPIAGENLSGTSGRWRTTSRFVDENTPSTVQAVHAVSSTQNNRSAGTASDPPVIVAITFMEERKQLRDVLGKIDTHLERRGRCVSPVPLAAHESQPRLERPTSLRTKLESAQRWARPRRVSFRNEYCSPPTQKRTSKLSAPFVLSSSSEVTFFTASIRQNGAEFQQNSRPNRSPSRGNTNVNPTEDILSPLSPSISVARCLSLPPSPKPSVWVCDGASRPTNAKRRKSSISHHLTSMRQSLSDAVSSTLSSVRGDMKEKLIE